jgi:hypothetical protein
MNILIVCDISGYVIIYYDSTDIIIKEIIIAKNLDISAIASFINHNDYDFIYVNTNYYRTFKKYFPLLKIKPIPCFEYEDEIQNFFFKLGLKEIKLIKPFHISFNYNEKSVISMALASFSKVTTRVGWARYA